MQRDKVRRLIEELLQRKGDLQPFEDSDSLVLSGRLDSLDVLEVVAFLEREFHVDFGDQPFDQQIVDSVDEIAALAGAALDHR